MMPVTKQWILLVCLAMMLVITICLHASTKSLEDHIVTSQQVLSESAETSNKPPKEIYFDADLNPDFVEEGRTPKPYEASPSSFPISESPETSLVDELLVDGDETNAYDHFSAPYSGHISAFSPLSPVASWVDSAPSPVLRPCGAHLQKNTHFADRSFWHSLKSEQMHQKRRDWQNFLHVGIKAYEDYDSYKFSGRGVVYLTSGRTLDRTIASVRLLKKHGCKLPIQAWFMTGELSAGQAQVLTDMGVEPKDIKLEQLNFPTLEEFYIGHTAYGSSENYQIKSLVLALTQFEEILYLDSDNMPLRDPTFLFESEGFVSTGAFFWRDFWKFPSDNPLWQITEQPCEDEWEQESGQLVLDKRRSWKPLLMSMFFQRDHSFYFKLILGDKDTFRFAWKVTGTPYHMSEHHVGIAGRIRQDRFCGHTMLQPGPDGVFLFAHTTAMKTTHALKAGNTWETMQYFIPADYVKAAGPTDEEHVSYSVSYPLTFEYRGGLERLANGDMPTYTNPCLSYSVEPINVATTMEVVDTLGLQKALDSFSVVTQSFSTYENGLFKDFEKEYYEYGGPGSRVEATCGNGNRGNGICAVSGECCSAWGWCGKEDEHCGIGCAGGPCYKDRRVPAVIPKGMVLCGGGKVGYGICKTPETECCSTFGWCGTSAEYCSEKFCLSGPCTH